MRITLSDEAVKYYNYQRCATKRMTHDKVEIFAYTFHKKIYEQIKDYVPTGKKCMDVGCGIGIINIFTGSNFDEIYLVDKTVPIDSLENTYYGFHGEGYDTESDSIAIEKDDAVSSDYCFYNDLHISKQLLEGLNKTVVTLEPKELGNLEHGSFDFIQSHASWGWHYPFSQYPVISTLLRKNGILIVDIRDNTLGPDDLVEFNILDQLKNREPNSRKYILEKC